MDKTFRDYIRMCRTANNCCNCPIVKGHDDMSCIDYAYDHSDLCGLD